MRISDWSSDVCSSDLGGLARQVVLDHAQPLLGVRGVVVGNHRREQAGVVRVLAGADADPALPLRVGQVLVGEGVELDRKSVVEGKGVSVRVDLGGPRIIKKKKNNKKTRTKTEA